MVNYVGFNIILQQMGYFINSYFCEKMSNYLYKDQLLRLFLAMNERIYMHVFKKTEKRNIDLYAYERESYIKPKKN